MWSVIDDCSLLPSVAKREEIWFWVVLRLKRKIFKHYFMLMIWYIWLCITVIIFIHAGYLHLQEKHFCLKSNINTFSVRYFFYWTIWFSHSSYEWHQQRCLEISIWLHLRIPLNRDDQCLILFREIRPFFPAFCIYCWYFL